MFSENANENQDVVGTYSLPRDVGEGFFYTEHLDDGLSIIYADYKLRDGAVSTREIEYGTDVVFRCRAAGKVVVTYSGSDEIYEFDEGTCGVITTREAIVGIAREESTGDRKVQVTLRVTRKYLKSLLKGHDDKLLAALSDKKQHIYCDVRSLPPQADILIQQILRCPYEDKIKTLYLKAKSFELMTLFLGAAEAPKVKLSMSLKFSAADIERIKSARDFLALNLIDPPSMEELATKVGMKPTKLKLGFKQVFGVTTFNYLRDRRLEYAWKILSEGSMSVEGVAKSAGYTNASHFTQAFQKHYGVLPKAVRGQRL